MFYKNSSMYDKKITFKEYKSVSFSKGLLDDKDNNEFGACDIVYNFDYNSGALTDCCGVSKLVTRYGSSVIDSSSREFAHINNRQIKKCFYRRMLQAYPGDFVSVFMYLDTQDKFYYYIINRMDSTPINVPELDTQSLYGMLFTYVDGIEHLLMSRTDTQTVPMWCPYPNYEVKTIDNTCRYTSMCYFDNRTFATTRFPQNSSVFYSDEFNPTNFRINNKNTGCVKFEDELGRCLLLLVFNDNVYVFREFGISKLVKNRDKVTYDGEYVYKAQGVIFSKTVCICGDKILFMTSNGLYEFDGNNVKKINLGFDGYIDITLYSSPTAAYLDGVYYLNTKIDYKDDETILCESKQISVQNVLIKYNVLEKTSSICRGLEILSFAPILDEINCAMAVVYYADTGFGFGTLDNSGTILSEPIKKFWKSKPYDFGTSTEDKYIKEMRLLTKSDIKIKLYLDDKEKVISVKGKSTMQTIKINKKAKVFAYGFESLYGNNYISDVSFVVGKYGEK